MARLGADIPVGSQSQGKVPASLLGSVASLGEKSRQTFQKEGLTAMLCRAAVSGAGQFRLGAGLD